MQELIINSNTQEETNNDKNTTSKGGFTAGMGR